MSARLERSSEQSPGWGDDFSRLTIASAVFGDLIEKLPGAFSEKLFGDAQAPRQRIARVVERYIRDRGSRPSAEIVRDLLDAEMASETEPEKRAVYDEWLAVQAIELPEDPAYVEEKLRGWIDRTRFGQAIIDAATAFDNPDGLTIAREILAKATPIGTLSPLIINAGDPWDFGEIEWIVDSLIPKRGLMFVGAVAKTAKSLITHYFGYALTCGRPFLFGVPTFPVKDPKVRILYVSEEEDGAILSDRRRDLLRPYGFNQVPNDRFAIMVKGGVDILDPAWIARLAEICNREDRRMLILDTYEAVTPSANPKEIGDHKKVLLNLRKLADDIDGVVIVNDHSKLPDRDGKKKMLLSHLDLAWSAIKGQRADHFLMIAETAEEGRFECFLGGRLTGEKRRFLLTRSPKGSAVEKFQFAGSFDPVNAARQERQDSKRAAIISELRASGDWMTRIEIQEATGVGKTTAATILSRLYAEKTIEAKGSESSPSRAYRIAKDLPGNGGERLNGSSENTTGVGT